MTNCKACSCRSTGTLTQTDWGGVERLWRAAAGRRDADVIATSPVNSDGADDGVARNLGLAFVARSSGGVVAGDCHHALLVNAVGIIGFIGLFAPLLAKMLGRGVCCHG